MKKTLAIGVLLLATIFIVTGCNNKNTPTNNTKTTKTAEVIQTIAGGIPYSWEYKIADSSIVKLNNTKSNSEATDSIGAEESTRYIFESLKEGKTTITFELKSVIDDSVEQTKKYNVVVDKNLNITITEAK